MRGLRRERWRAPRRTSCRARGHLMRSLRGSRARSDWGVQARAPRAGGRSCRAGAPVRRARDGARADPHDTVAPGGAWIRSDAAARARIAEGVRGRGRGAAGAPFAGGATRPLASRTVSGGRTLSPAARRDRIRRRPRAVRRCAHYGIDSRRRGTNPRGGRLRAGGRVDDCLDAGRARMPTAERALE